MKAIRENLLLQFSAVTLVILAAVLVLTSWWMTSSMKRMILDQATSEAVDTVSRRLSSRLSPEDFQQPMTGERYNAFRDFMEESIVSDRTARIKLWSPQGQVIFSTDRSQVGQTFPIKEELARALEGGIGREISVPQAAENERERMLGTLIEVYAPIRAPGRGEVVGAFETYQYFAPFARQISQQHRSLYLSMATGGLVLYLALFFIVLGGWRTIQRQRRDINLRLQEVQGLNALLQGDLAQRQHVIEVLQDLSARRVSMETLHREELLAEYSRLKGEVQRLAEEASRFPLRSSNRG